MPRDVFISHSAQDKKVAETICAALEQAGIRCWVAPRDVRPGRSFPGEITRAIQQSKVMLLVFSKHSNSSEQVLREIQLAVDCHVPIVRLRIEDITLSDDLRYYLSTPQYLDALTTPLSKHIPRVEAAIRELLEQSTDEGGKSTAVDAPAASEVLAKNRALDLPQKPPANWKQFVIGAVIVAAVGLTVWTLRSPNKPEIRRAEPVTQPTPEATAETAPTLTPVAVAVVPSPSPTEQPQPSPTSQVNKKEPAPKNNRAWQVWMDEFVHNFIASNESNDLDLAVSFYAPTVDLFEEGKKSVDAIRRDVEGYNARWPSRRATIRGDVRLSEKAANRAYTATFEHDYYVENAARGEWINGAVAVDLQITVTDGIPKISSMKQKTLRKEKGTMQPR
jgi:cell division septation protein DedD